MGKTSSEHLKIFEVQKNFFQIFFIQHVPYNCVYET